MMPGNRKLLVLLLAAALCFGITGCAGEEEGAISSAPESVSSAAEAPAGDSAALPDDSLASEEPLVYTDEALHFQVELPELLKGHLKIETATRQAYGETVSTVGVYYQNGDAVAHVLSLEEMSEEVWQQMQAEGGPLGEELARSQDGRVVVLNTLQSNPFAEGTEDYELFQQLPDELAVVRESFKVLPEE